MTDVTVPEAHVGPTQVTMTRAWLLAEPTGEVDVDLARQIVASATRSGAVARVAAGELKMVDLWCSADGLVSQGRVAGDDVPRAAAIWPAPLVALGVAEFFKQAPVSEGAGDAAFDARYETVEILIEAVASGRVGPGATLCVLRWRLADGTSFGVARASTESDTLWGRLAGDGPVDLRSGDYLDFAAALFEGTAV